MIGGDYILDKLHDVIVKANGDAILLLVLLITCVIVVLRKSEFIDNKFIPVYEFIVGVVGGMFIYLAFPSSFANIYIPIIDGIIAALIGETGNQIYSKIKHE